jgi:hypothetical protein
MFEKEAEEYSNNWKINKNNDLNFAELVELRAVIYKAYKDGAEFGYNKANEEIKQKFNEWLEENGGTDGALYQTFSDDELEHIFMSAYVKNNKR